MKRNYILFTALFSWMLIAQPSIGSAAIQSKVKITETIKIDGKRSPKNDKAKKTDSKASKQSPKKLAKPEARTQPGVYFVDGNRIRLDEYIGKEIRKSYIVNQKTGETTLVFHPPKKYIKTNVYKDTAWEQKHWGVVSSKGLITNPEIFKTKGYKVKKLKDQVYNKKPVDAWRVSKVINNRETSIDLWKTKAKENQEGQLVKMSFKNNGVLVNSLEVTSSKKVPKNFKMFSPPAKYSLHEPKLIYGATTNVDQVAKDSKDKKMKAKIAASKK